MKFIVAIFALVAVFVAVDAQLSQMPQLPQLPVYGMQPYNVMGMGSGYPVPPPAGYPSYPVTYQNIPVMGYPISETANANSNANTNANSNAGAGRWY